jgi:hypothetical protein
MAQVALSNRQRRLMKKGRPRLVGIARQPNGQPSRAKGNVAPVYSWLAPSLVREMNVHPVDKLEQRGAITPDQRRAAYSWIADRAASGLPYPAPPSLNLTGVRAAAEDYGIAGAARRYNEMCHVLKNRCGVYGHSLAHEMVIQGQLNRVIESYLFRIGQRPALDPLPRQHLAWRHLQLAFTEMENYYAAQAKRKLDRKTDAA